MSYITFSSQEKYLFLLFSYFRAHPTTLLLKILGWTNAWAVPHLKLWGDRPPVPLGFRPCPNLQFHAAFPAHVPSQTLRHPANPLYSIIIVSHPFSTPGHFSSHGLQPSHAYPSLHHVFGMTYHLNSSPFL